MASNDLITRILIQAKDEASGAFSTLNNTLTSTINQVKAVIGAWVGFEGIKSITNNVIDASSEFENLRTRLIGLFSDTQKGQQAFEWIKAFAERTPYDLQSTTQAFSNLKIAGIDPANGSLEKIANAVAKAGGSSQDLTEITRQLAQSFSSGRIQADEMNSLIERGIPVWQLMSSATGKSVAELRNLSEAGKLGAADVNTLVDALGKWGDGSLQAAAGTWSQIVSNFEDRVKSAWAQVGEAGVFDFAKQKAQEFSDALQKFMASEAGKQFAKNLSDAMVQVGTALADGAKWVADFISKTDFTQVSASIKTFVSEAVNNIPKVQDTAEKAAGVISIAFNGIAGSASVVGIAISKLTALVYETLALYDEYIARDEDAKRKHMEAVNQANKAAENFATVAKNSFNSAGEAANKLAVDLTSTKQAAIDTGDAAKKSAQDFDFGSQAADDWGASLLNTGNAAGGLRGSIQNLTGTTTDNVRSGMEWVNQLRQTYEHLKANGASSDELQVAYNNLKNAEEAAKLASEGHAAALNKVKVEAEITAQELQTYADKVASIRVHIEELKQQEAAGKNVKDELAKAQSDLNVALDSYVKKLQEAQQQAKYKTEDDNRELELIRGKYQALIQESQSREKVAQATQNQQAIYNSHIQTLQLEIQQLKEVSVQQQAILKDKEKEFQLAKQEVDADGIRTVAEQERIKALEQGLEKQKQEIDQTETAIRVKQNDAQAYAIQAQKAREAAAAAQELSAAKEAEQEAARQAAAGEAFHNRVIADGIGTLEQYGKSTDDVAAKLRAFGAEHAKLAQSIINAGGFANISSGIAAVAPKLAGLIDQLKVLQQFSLTNPQEAMRQMAGLAQTLENQLSSIPPQLRSIAEEQLTGIRSAMADLKQKTDEASKSMQALAASTKQALEIELARKQGNDLLAAQIESTQKLKDLQTKLSEAQKLGNGQAIADLNESVLLQTKLNKLNELEIVQKSQHTTSSNNTTTALKEQLSVQNQITQATAATVDQQNRNTAAVQHTNRAIQGQDQQQVQATPVAGRNVTGSSGLPLSDQLNNMQLQPRPSTTITFVGPGGSTVSGQFGPNDVTQLLGILRQSGLSIA